MVDVQDAVEKVRSAAPSVSPENKGAAVLMASITGVGAILTALGVSGGLVGRMARNHEILSGLAFIAALLAVGMGFIAAYTGRAAREKTFLNRGIALFVIAGICAVWAGIGVWN